MANPLLDRHIPAELADSLQVIEFKGVLKEFPRLSDIVESDLGSAATHAQWRDGPVTIKLRFGWADPHRSYPLVEGEASVSITAVCQRCLEVFEADLTVTLELLLVLPEVDQPSDELAGVSEVWELGEATFRPIDLVEEALIMAMPLAPTHPADTGCSVVGAPESASTEVNKVRPFADLKAQMAGKD